MEAESWVTQLERKYGMPVHEIPGTVYILHYFTPQVVKSVSIDYAGDNPALTERGFVSQSPITHYVGWTQQSNPRKRIYAHGPVKHCKIFTEPGTMQDEQQIKLTRLCPECSEPLCNSLAK